MRHAARSILPALAAMLLAAGTAAADTVYKYRRPDGRTVYSNRLEPGLELIESFEYRFGPAKPALAGTAKSDAESEARIRRQLDALQSAWTEVQDAQGALAAAEERRRTESDLQAGEHPGVATGAAPPAAGGVPPPAPPAVGGPMSGHRGRPSPEYVARIRALDADVAAARERLDRALRAYNQLR